MNIFFLDNSPKISAEMLCDKHVVKMILESTQMLCTAHRVLDKNDNEVLYRATHINHPSTVWVRSNRSNYLWLFNHFSSMCNEYTYRYGKTHLSETKLLNILQDPPKNIPYSTSITSIPLAMPDEYKCNDPVESYRNYYVCEKRGFAKWTKRVTPDWFLQKLCLTDANSVV